MSAASVVGIVLIAVAFLVAIYFVAFRNLDDEEEREEAREYIRNVIANPLSFPRDPLFYTSSSSDFIYSSTSFEYPHYQEVEEREVEYRIYECLYCSSTFDSVELLKMNAGRCPNCGAPLDKKRLEEI